MLKKFIIAIKKAISNARLWQRYVVGVLLIVLGAVLRIWPLGALGVRAPWITFYPMMMFAALFGGLYVGLLGTSLSCLIILYGYQFVSSQPFIKDSSDLLGMGVFFFNGAMISFIAEAMRRAQTQARIAKETSEAANKAKSIFLANMSHELRTPLNAILGFAQVLKRSEDATPKQKSILEIISRSGEHLLSLINNILDISKIESGRVVLEERDTDLLKIIHQIHSSMHGKAVEKNLSFNVEVHPDVPKYVHVDEIKLTQVLFNLIGNAIKFTGNGGVILRVFQNQGADSRKVVLRFEVEDSGPGIREEDREKVFNSFMQLKDRPSSEAGTGLGLTISRQNVKLMGGAIGITGEFGKGSVFFFEIPVKKIFVEVQSKELEKGDIIGIEDTKKEYRILIAEDQPENRLLLHELLEPFRFILKDAVNGREAVEISDEWNPALIFMDIRMPELSGLEATRIIKQREDGKNTIIIALTAHALEEERLEILEAGCDDVIRKPYKDYEIFNALAKHLGVRFINSEIKTPETEILFNLNIEELQNLPIALLEELFQAAELLDKQLVISVIKIINQTNTLLAAQLRTMVDEFRFKELLTSIDLVRKKNTYDKK